MPFSRIPCEIDTSFITAQTYPNGVRIYENTLTKDKWPSITTILQNYKKEVLDAWVKRVGYEESERIKKAALLRGNIIHEMADRYLNNEPAEFLQNYPQEYRNLFNAIRLKLNKFVSNIRVQESPLYSTKLRLAGRVDLIADWDGQLSVIDFKGSGGTKKEEWIDNYFIQVTFYALAWYELTGQVINQGVIIVANDGTKPKKFGPADLGNTVQIFKCDITKYTTALVHEIKKWYLMHDVNNP